MRVAAAYAALGASGKLGAAERREHWQTARDLYAQSLAVWQEMQKNGILTAEDAAKPQELAREIERCDAALRRLAGDEGDAHFVRESFANKSERPLQTCSNARAVAPVAVAARKATASGCQPASRRCAKVMPSPTAAMPQSSRSSDACCA